MSGLPINSSERAILAAISTGIILVDTTGKIVELNDAASAIHGLSRVFLLGRQITDPCLQYICEDGKILLPEDHPAMIAGRSSTLVGNSIFCLQNHHASPRAWMQVSAGVLHREGEKFVALTFSDVSKFVEKKIRLSESESRSVEAQTARLASLGVIAAGVAHEINNPLAVISGVTESFQRIAGNDRKLHDKIGKIIRAVERITKIVKALRKFSRSSEKSKKSPVSLSAVVRESTLLMEIKAKKSSTHISLHLNTESPVLCDEAEIEQVLLNLISNSIDAVSALPERWVKISVEQEYREVVLQVEDSGSGVPREIEHRLFEPFFTTKALGDGLGLGLSISKGIVDDHMGKISILTGRKHTTFELRFPVASVGGIGKAA